MKKNLFSESTLDSIAMSKLYGGENNTKCNTESNCIHIDCGCPEEPIKIDIPLPGDTISLPPQPNPLCSYCWYNVECPPPPTPPTNDKC